MFRPLALPLVFLVLTYTPIHFAQQPPADHPQAPTKSRNLAGTKDQQPRSAELKAHAHPSGSIPAITIHHLTDDGVSSLAYNTRPC